MLPSTWKIAELEGMSSSPSRVKQFLVRRRRKLTSLDFDTVPLQHPIPHIHLPTSTRFTLTFESEAPNICQSVSWSLTKDVPSFAFFSWWFFVGFLLFAFSFHFGLTKRRLSRLERRRPASPRFAAVTSIAAHRSSASSWIFSVPIQAGIDKPESNMAGELEVQLLCRCFCRGLRALVRLSSRLP